MDRLANQRWLRMALCLAIVYPVVGITFAVLDKAAALGQSGITWRLAAWFVCAAAFAAHLGHEHFRLRNSPTRAALHVSAAVALGAFALAVWILVHAHWGEGGASSHQSPLAPLALVVFPAVTGVPAFVVALVAVAVLNRTRRRSQ